MPTGTFEEANLGRTKSISAGTARGLERLERTTPEATDETATAAGGVDFRTREPDRRDVLGREETSGARLPVSCSVVRDICAAISCAR